MSPPTQNPATRTLRRARTGRVGAGVAAGLGRYFGLDPVLFRVLFATSAFFGGAGVIAYLLAWAAIPEEGTQRAPIDGFIAELRRRRVPVWAAVVGVGLLVWLLGFSWWAPGPFLPVLAVVILLIVVFGRRQLRTPSPASAPPPAPVDLTKAAATDETAPPWAGELRNWIEESRVRSRTRRSRALPIKIATLVTLAATMIVLGVIDGVTGIPLPVYFWAALGIVGFGLLLGIVLRRTPWSVATLLVPITLGTVAFAGTDASLHDGSGQRTWTPTTSVPGEYRLAFGRATLDLRSLTTPATARTVDVTLAAGRVDVLVPRESNIRVKADIRFGRLTYNGREREHGVGLRDVVVEPSVRTGATLTVDVHLEEGEVRVVRR